MYTKEDRKKKEQVLLKIAKKIDIKSKSYGESLGYEKILRSSALSIPENFSKHIDDGTSCNKDTEGIVTMNTFSRGHIFFVQPSGIIRFWNPIYRSEDPSQVAVTTIKFCFLFVKILKITILSSMFLFYDNMCNLERLKLWSCSNKDFSTEARLGVAIFNRINKGVDALHIKNHVRHSCKTEYPKIIQQLRNTFEKPNTEAAEQTFIWLGKFKKILNSMSKRKHHFYLHCLVKERNEYTQYCLDNKISITLPKLQMDRITLAPID